jgi:hypothetical protein
MNFVTIENIGRNSVQIQILKFGDFFFSKTERNHDKSVHNLDLPFGFEITSSSSSIAHRVVFLLRFVQVAVPLAHGRWEAEDGVGVVGQGRRRDAA